MKFSSVWDRYSKEKTYPKLQQTVTTDVAIIGGGITGVTTAKLLAEQGLDVVILESYRVGSGTTQYSTGNLYLTIDAVLSSLRSKYDIDVVKKVAQSRRQAMSQIEEWVQKHQIDCDHITVPWFLYSSYSGADIKVEEELAVGGEAELPFTEAEPSEIPFSFNKGIKINDQAQINPKLYVQGLADSLPSKNCRIFEKSHVTSIDPEGAGYVLSTNQGKTVASYVVHATHTPKGIMAIQTLLGPYREYGIACKIEKREHPPGIFWGYYEHNKKISSRTYTHGDDHYLVVVGEPHKVGHAKNNNEYINNLISFAEEHFEVEEVVHRWGGQHYRPADLLPYIGPRTKKSREFVATGFSTDGLVYGTLSGMILNDLIHDRENKWSSLYRATRKKPVKSAPKFIKENADVAKELIKVLPALPMKSDLESLSPGEGTIIQHKGRKYAAYYDKNKGIQLHSAMCPHMGCIVSWNNAEHSWDCPCHGSRFNANGQVLEGPALHPLSKIRIEEYSGKKDHDKI